MDKDLCAIFQDSGKAKPFYFSTCVGSFRWLVGWLVGWLDVWIPALVLQGPGISSDCMSVVAVSFHWMNRKLLLAMDRQRE